MCGRFVLTSSGEDLARIFEVPMAPVLRPRFNIAPTQDSVVVRADESGARRMDLLRWGLIPGWAKDPSIGNRTINARSETAAAKPAFRVALRRRRCLVPADGFYEWTGKKGARRAHLFRVRDGAPFAIAGLWESWRGPDGEGAVVESFTLLTTEANASMRPYHDRMPVILDPRDHARWLDPGVQEAEEVAALLVPSPPDWIHATPVGDWVNDVHNDDPACIRPAEAEAGG